MSDNLRQKILSGSFWTIGANVAGQFITFAVTIILARLLTPGDFGVIAISSVFTGIIALFQDLGMGSAIIQRKEVTDEYLSTSFTASLLAGVVIALSLIILSPFIARFYDVEILKPILIVSSIGFIISPFYSIHLSILNKRLDFKKTALINLLMNAFAGGASVALALNGFNVWSLVLGRIITQPVLIPLVWRITRWRPRFVLVWSCFREMFGYSSKLLAFNMLNYMVQNLDNLLIGKFLGPQILGYYSVSYNLMLKPLQMISWSVGKILFPVFSRMQDDLEKVRSMYLKVVRTISFVTFPMMTGLFMAAEEFMLTVYGEQWRPAIMTLKLLCFVGAIRSITTTGGVIYNSLGRSDITLKVGVVTSLMTMGGMLAGVYWGLNGLIIGYLCVSFPVFFIGQVFVDRLISLRFSDTLRTLVPAALSSLMMVAVLYAFNVMNHMSFHLSVKEALGAIIVVGSVSYFIFALKLFKIPEAAEAYQIVKRNLS